MNKYNFNDLLRQNIIVDAETGRSIQFDRIEIPMIQRDYAQGRETEQDVRKRFLDAIFDTLAGEENLDMDFVYGSVYESENEKDKEQRIRIFTPLDGQQRLTTLFLLYWYISSRELMGDELDDTMKALRKFSYSTRTSSRKFCEDICSKYDRIAPELERNSPREVIRNFPWYYSSYEKDPTVKAMLNMLEDIHARYSRSGRQDLFGKLDNLMFYVLPLDGFDLTEELYVKMNARGKPLTDFENFKADFIKWMKSNDSQQGEFHKTTELDARQMEYYMAVSQKLDNDWSDIFWQVIKDLPAEDLKPHGYVVDPFFMRFLNRYLCNLVILNSADAETVENNKIFRYFYGNEGDDQHIKFRSFSRYEELLNFDVVEGLWTVMEGLAGNMDIIRRYINPSWEEQKSWNMFDGKITQRQRIAFYATTAYIEHNKKFEESAYADWMRVVWNLIVDSGIRNIPAMVRAMKQIKEFSVWSDDVLSGLSAINECEVINSKMDEEATKARLILKEPHTWGDAIKKAESHRLFKGEIRFLLPYADSTSLNDFSADATAAERIFEGNDLDDKHPENYLWIMAALAKNKDYPAEITLLNGRFDNWKALINNQLLPGFRGVIDNVKAESSSSVHNIMRKICHDYQYDDRYPWVYPIVTWEGKNGEILLQYSETKKIQNYNYYGYWHEQTYLYNKNRWTDGNIILSSRRNEICAAIIERYGFTMDWEYGNIQNRFFRGSDVELSKDLMNCTVVIWFDTQYMRVGIRENENKHLNTTAIKVEPEFAAESWIWRKKYDYLIIDSDEKTEKFISEFEQDILSDENPNSLISLIKAGN